MNNYVLALAAVVLATLVVGSWSQATTVGPTSNEDICRGRNGSCSECTSGGAHNGSAISFRCYWCQSSRRCGALDVNTILPVRGIVCPSLRHNVATCRLDVLSIIIIIAVACLVFVVLICCICCCCCIFCANRRRRMKIIEENRYADEKDSIRQKSAERRAERKAKHEEIRRKYGMLVSLGFHGRVMYCLTTPETDFAELWLYLA